MVCDLGLDWRMGVEWFEMCFFDYDFCLNYGNWIYGVGKWLIYYYIYVFMN